MIWEILIVIRKIGHAIFNIVFLEYNFVVLVKQIRLM